MLVILLKKTDYNTKIGEIDTKVSKIDVKIAKYISGITKAIALLSAGNLVTTPLSFKNSSSL